MNCKRLLYSKYKYIKIYNIFKKFEHCHILNLDYKYNNFIASWAKVFKPSKPKFNLVITSLTDLIWVKSTTVMAHNVAGIVYLFKRKFALFLLGQLFF